MEPFDVIEYISSRFVLSAVAPEVNSLPLEHPEESLAFLRGYLRNIRHPFGVRLQSGEVPLQMVSDTWWPTPSGIGT